MKLEGNIPFTILWNALASQTTKFSKSEDARQGGEARLVDLATISFLVQFQPLVRPNGCTCFNLQCSMLMEFLPLHILFVHCQEELFKSSCATRIRSSASVCFSLSPTSYCHSHPNIGIFQNLKILIKNSKITFFTLIPQFMTPSQTSVLFDKFIWNMDAENLDNEKDLKLGKHQT